ncbi:DUF7523 family protein [Natrarchaeobaculum aegyptiacum]|uniref:Uncharacterized protein n=1 Tax=Natrarchaeobaculum aegyptiacum TaxID=745377 RepID=A0A2Z2I1C7_9EURY|nr:hypothetical protein [Natrarchaeobaculum aegyptiacum]ARS91574.1 hypothetical protein B1756_18830 [Natrarchaeobaculum aegyptiacum]
MSLAAETRRAVEVHPFLRQALRAGVVNYTAAARFLEVDGETDAIATALRRYTDELPDYESASRDVRVRMESGYGRLEDPTDDHAMVTVGTTAFGPIDGDLTGIVATGEVDGRALATVLERLSIDGIDPEATAVADDALFVVVDRLDGATAVRTIEGALEGVPSASS